MKKIIELILSWYVLRKENKKRDDIHLLTYKGLRVFCAREDRCETCPLGEYECVIYKLEGDKWRGLNNGQ